MDQLPRLVLRSSLEEGWWCSTVDCQSRRRRQGHTVAAAAAERRPNF